MTLYAYGRCDGVAAVQSVSQVPTKRFINLKNGKICTASACSSIHEKAEECYRTCGSALCTYEIPSLLGCEAETPDVQT